MEAIYHVCSREDWEGVKEHGVYVHPSLGIEGFIHCSTEPQVAGVLSRYFNGQKNLVRLEIEPQKLRSELKWETSPSLGEAFPHIYGPINIDAVVGIEGLEDGEA